MLIFILLGVLLLSKANKEGKKEGIWTLHSAEEKFQEALRLVPGGTNELYFLSFSEYKLSKDKQLPLAEKIGRIDMAASRLKYLRKSLGNIEEVRVP